jgi:hypothetical protein
MLLRRDAEQGDVLTEKPDCFYCHETLSALPVIEWLGAAGEIFLHPDCATNLCIRLLRDVHEYQCQA